MLSFCYTDYVIVFKDENDAKEAKEILDSNEKEFFCYHHFYGVLDKFGIEMECDEDTDYIKKEIKLANGNELRFSIKSFTRKEDAVRKAFENKFPDCKVFFVEENLCENIYVTNDRDKKYFEYPICLSFWATEADDGDIEYYHTDDEVISRFNELYKRDCKTLNEVKTESVKLPGEHEDDFFDFYPIIYEE